MTLMECKESVRSLFAQFYPGCTVILDTPNVARPPLPYIVLTFGEVDVQDKHQRAEDGILYQEFYSTVAMTAELVTSSAIVHEDGVKKSVDHMAVEDLSQASLFLASEYAHDWTVRNDIAVSATSGITPVNNSLNGVSSVLRSRCTYQVDFVQSTKEYAAIHPATGDYTHTTTNAAQEIADAETGWFDSVAVEYERSE